MRRDLPTYRELIYPTLRAVASLGGSAQGAEITDPLTELLKVTPEQLAVTYDGRPKSVLIDRMDWARSYAKLAGALDSPRRGLFILSNLGKHILSLPEEEGRAQVAQLDRNVRAARRRRGSAAYSEELVEPDEGETGIGASAGDVEAGEDGAWREALLARLHRLSPAGFEEFTLYLLRTFGIELTRVGGVGDEGIDGLGLAPISAVLSSRTEPRPGQRPGRGLMTHPGFWRHAVRAPLRRLSRFERLGTRFGGYSRLRRGPGYSRIGNWAWFEPGGHPRRP